MSIIAKQRAQETLVKINRQLIENPQATPLKEDKVTAIIKEYIDEAYNKLSPEEKQIFYRQLAFNFHPDRKLSNFPQLYDLLVRLKIDAMPIRYLTELNDLNIQTMHERESRSLLSHLLSEEYQTSMLQSYDRYYQPFKFLSHAIYWTIAIGVAAIQIVFSFPTYVMNKAIGLSLNFITNKQYEEELNKEDIIFANENNISLFKRLKLISLSLFKTLTKPLEENKFVSIFIRRPLLLLASPFILSAVAGVGLINYAIEGLNYANSLIFLSISYLLKSPLYMVDLSAYILQKIQECIYHKDESNTDDLDNQGSKTLLMLEWHEKCSLAAEIPPTHSKPLFTVNSGLRREMDKTQEFSPEASLTATNIRIG